MTTIETFEPILTNSTLSDSSSSQPLDNIIVANADYKVIIAHICQKK